MIFASFAKLYPEGRSTIHSLNRDPYGNRDNCILDHVELATREARAKLCRSGFGEQLLLSQDVGHKHDLREFGGWGYGHVLHDFSHHKSRSRPVHRVLIRPVPDASPLRGE